MIFSYEFAKLESLISYAFLNEAQAQAHLILKSLGETDSEKKNRKYLLDFCQNHQINLTNYSPPQTQQCNTLVSEWPSSKKQGISLVTACMNRNENLCRSLRTWLEIPEIREILIVDWTSEVPVHNDIYKQGISDSRIKIIRVENEPKWILSHAFNLGFQLTEYDRVLKVDADILISQDFFKKNTLSCDEIITGDWRVAEENQKHINGFFYTSHATLMKVHGFNEFIQSYGWDDDDLYYRLHRENIKRTVVQNDTIFHQFHNDHQRLDKHSLSPKNSIEELSKSVDYQIRINQIIADIMPFWGRNSGFRSFNIKERSDQYLQVEKAKPSTHVVHEHIAQDCAYYAAIDFISRHTGRGIYKLPKDAFWTYANTKKLADMQHLDISVMLHSKKAKDVTRKTWMINCYKDVYEQHFKSNEVLQALSDYCTKYQVDIVLRINEEDFSYDQKSIEEFEHLYSIPTRETYVNLNFGQAMSILQAFKLNSNIRYVASHLRLRDAEIFIEGLFTEATKFTQALGTNSKIYVDTMHGLGNRLRAIASAGVIAERSGRELVIVWEPDHHCQARFSDLFSYKGAVIERSPFKTLPNTMNVYNYMEIEENSQKDAETFLCEGKDLYVRTNCVINNMLSDWDGENQFLKSLTTNNHVAQLVSSLNVENRTAVHIRMEGADDGKSASYDKAENWSKEGLNHLKYWREKSHFTHFVKHMDSIIDNNNNTAFFLATDKPETYELFADRYGKRINFLRRDLYDRSPEQIQYALADIILLSKCKNFIGSTWSSFSEIALRLNENYDRIEMSGNDF